MVVIYEIFNVINLSKTPDSQKIDPKEDYQAGHELTINDRIWALVSQPYHQAMSIFNEPNPWGPHIICLTFGSMCTYQIIKFIHNIRNN
jgi:hypothetical protein